MRRLRILSAVVGLIAIAWGPAYAQSVGATTGAINGKVSDTTGGVMPGVTVTIASPSMQGVRTAVTDEEGSYRFPAIPPGEYKITYELAGFSTVNREGIRVGLGFTATVNTELSVASLTESVTVSGQSPVVDITSTKTATNFDAAELASIPSARDFWAILAAAPAIQMQRIDVGGSAAGTQTGYSTYDTKADQHRPMVEGIVNTEGTNAAGFYYDYGSFDEVSVATGTNTAEMPWPGVMSQFISKSGGNTYHGKIYADYENEKVQSRNIDADQIRLGLKAGGGLTETDLNRLHSYYDLNGDVGGYLKPDKIWWYGSLRDQKVQSLLPNFPVKPFETHLSNISAKVTYAHQHEQQADWVRDVGQEDTAEPARHLPCRGDGGHPHQRRLDLEPGVLGPHLQRRVGQRRQRPGVLRNPRRPVRLCLAELPATRTVRRTPTSAPTSSAAATATAGSISRRATRCWARSATTRTAGAARTTSRSAARSSTSGSTTSAGRTASATCLAT